MMNIRTVLVQVFIINFINIIIYCNFFLRKKKMRKTVIKTCSCYLDKAFWFINTPKLKPYWFFDIVTPSSPVISDCFILERHTLTNTVNGEFFF